MKTWNYLEWAEQAGIENLRQRLETSTHLQAQASNLLQLTVAGSGATVVLVFKQDSLSPMLADPVSAGYLAAGLWLTWLAVVLLFTCIRTKPVELVTNEPLNLFQRDWVDKFSEDQIRESELENLQARINLTKVRNERVAKWLDHCRYAVTATPFVFGVTFWVCR